LNGLINFIFGYYETNVLYWFALHDKTDR